MRKMLERKAMVGCVQRQRTIHALDEEKSCEKAALNDEAGNSVSPRAASEKSKTSLGSFTEIQLWSAFLTHKPRSLD